MQAFLNGLKTRKELMKPENFIILFSMSCIFCVSVAVNPACECVVYQSFGYSQGVFTSPNFPVIYPTNLNCILYTFIGDLNEIVELTFLEFDLKVPITNKCTDYLRFFIDLQRSEVNEGTKWQYELCGNISMVQKTHYSSSRALILEFHTDSLQGNHTGFKGIFKFINKGQFLIEGGSRRWGTQCSYEFNSNKSHPHGRFFSPKYPQNYPAESNCVYELRGQEAHERVKVTFQNVQLETIDGSCADSPDYIIVHDGEDANAPVIGHYCNTLNGQQVISSGRNLYIEFVADEKKQRKGFAATFEFFIDEYPSHHSNDHKNIESHKQGGIGWDKGPPTSKDYPYPPGSNTHSPGDSPDNKKHDDYPDIVTDCVYEYLSTQAKNGTFTSPRSASSKTSITYDPDTACRYIFKGKGLDRVQIQFTEMDLNYPVSEADDPYDCEDVDAITIYTYIDGEKQTIGTYCGSKIPPMVMSNGNELEMIFQSYSTSSGTNLGFKAEYRFVQDFGIKAGKQDPSQVCGFNFNSRDSTNGTFTSPNYPGYYPRNTECHYLFTGRENEKIYITFPSFDVEGIPPNCLDDTSSDYIEFSNFNKGLQDRKMKRLCGTKSDNEKREVNSDGNFFRVTFKSNEVYDGTGFEAFYQFREYNDPFGKGKADSRQSPNGCSSHYFTYWLHLLVLTSLHLILIL